MFGKAEGPWVGHGLPVIGQLPTTVQFIIQWSHDNDFVNY